MNALSLPADASQGAQDKPDLNTGGLSLQYQVGWGNEFETEAVESALPKGQNSPQKAPYGLVSELVSGTTFSAPRALNRRTYMFRTRPSTHAFRQVKVESGEFLTPPFDLPCDPNDYAWAQFAVPANSDDFITGLRTLCGNGTPALQTGISLHIYLANRSMLNTAFSNSDGEMLVIPQKGALRIVTELGILRVDVGEIVLIPRGIKMRVELESQEAGGFVCENYGAPFRLPELGLIGSNGLANAVHFKAPVAAFEDRDVPYCLLHKFGGNIWRTEIGHSPFNVVAWRGNLAPFKYDMNQFVALGTVTIDHPDPSIYCALTSPSDDVAGPNADFMVLPSRWDVSEHTLRVPGYHRNCVAEFAGFLGAPHTPTAIGSILHNNWVAHGPGTDSYERSRIQELLPEKINALPIFMIESRFPMQITEYAASVSEARHDYIERWGGFNKRFDLGER